MSALANMVIASHTPSSTLTMRAAPVPSSTVSDYKQQAAVKHVVKSFTSTAINSADNVDNVLRWLEDSNRITARGFAKRLPHTTRDIIDGKINPNAIVASLSLVATWFQKDNTDSMPLAQFTMRVTRLAVVPEWGNVSGVGFRFQTRLSSFLCDRSLLGVFTPRNLYDWVHEAARDIAGDADKSLFHGRKGTFLRICPLLKVPLNRWGDLMDKILEQTRINSMEQLHQSANHVRCLGHDFEHIVDEIDSAYCMCWQCGSHFEDVSSCSRCQTALYCHRTCQVAAWKAGHKNQCRLLKQQRQEFEELLGQVDAQYQELAPTGVRLVQEVDYETAFAVFDTPLKLNEKDKGVEGPSMKIYYENLTRVFNDQWWSLTDEEARAYKKRVDENTKFEKEAFQNMARFLCYNWFGSTDVSLAEATRNLVKAKFKTYFSCPMPADRFVTMYTKSSKEEDNTPRRDAKLSADSKFRKCHC